MEFILQVEDKPFVNGAKKLYKSTAFESLVFDQKGLNKLERYDRARHKAEKYELTKLRGQVDDLCNEVNRLTSLKCKSYEIGFQEGYDTGLKKLHDALKIISAMPYNKRMTLFGASSITDIFAKYDPFEIIDIVTKPKSDKEKKDFEYKLLCEVKGDISGRKAVVCAIHGDNLTVLFRDPRLPKNLINSVWGKNVCKPTGKVYSDLLEFIEDADEESN